MGLKLRNVLLPAIPFAATVCGWLVPAEPGLAQQSLCSPCIDPPLPSERRRELSELRGMSTGDVRELIDRAEQTRQAESGNGSVVQ